MKFQLLFISLLVACASSVSVELGANQQTDLSVNALFGADVAAAISSLSYTNGNVSANVTFTPIAAADLSTSFTSLFTNVTNFNAVFNAALGGKIGFSFTSNVTGGGQLTFVVAAGFSSLNIGINNSVLLSTPFASGQADSNSVVYVPSAAASGSSQVSFSLAFNRNYSFAVLASTTSVGYTLATAYQALFGTLSNVANRAYLQFSATQNAFSQTAAAGSAQAGNAYVQLFNRLGDATQLTVSTKTYASGAVVAPNGTVNNVGVQFSIVATSNNFNGDLTYVSNGATVTGKGTANFSWYKAASNTASALGWTKVASTSTVDSNGNLVVTATVSGSFSEWAVASDNSATSTSATTSSSNSVPLSSTTTNSASSVAIGSLALIGAVALAF